MGGRMTRLWQRKPKEGDSTIGSTIEKSSLESIGPFVLTRHGYNC